MREESASLGPGAPREKLWLLSDRWRQKTGSRSRDLERQWMAGCLW